MGGIKTFIILPVAALHLAIMPRCIRAYELMADAVASQMLLKESRLVRGRGKAVGELRTVICLDTLNRAGKSFYQMFNKQGRGIGAVFLKGFHITPSGIFVDGSILEELFTDDLTVDEAGRGDEFHINLEALAGVFHLLVGLRDVFRVRRMDSHDTLLFKEAVETGDGAGITTLHEFYPKYDESGIGITPAHIGDEFNLFGGVLVRMVVRSAGEVTEGINGAVKAPFPAVNILSVGFVFNGSICNTIFFSVFNKR